jgi:RNA polymerase sigma factor (sigma-70 family)
MPKPPLVVFPSRAAQDLLIEQHLSVVRKVAGKLRPKLPPSIDVDDLESAGLIGLLRAAEEWNPARKTKRTKFSSYAYSRVKWAMLDSLRRREWQNAACLPLLYAERIPTDAGIEEKIDQGRRRERLTKAIEGLPATERGILQMQAQGHDMHHVCRVLEITTPTAYRRRHQAIKQLQQKFKAA